MAKVLRQFGASLTGAKTHDADDTAMRELGATGVFRNLAFQGAAEESIISPTEKCSTPTGIKRNSVFAINEPEKHKETFSESIVSPASRDNLQGAQMWASPPLTPVNVTAMKRGSHGGPVPTPKGCQRPSTGKRLKNTTTGNTQIEAIASPAAEPRPPSPEAWQEQPDDEERQDSDDGTGAGAVAASPSRWNHTSVCNFSNSNATAVHAWEEEVKRLLAAGRQEEAIHRVAPSDGMIHCTVRRVKNFLGNTIAYHLFLDSGDVFLLAARKRKKSKVSNFVLSTSQDDLAKDSSCCVAKLRANFVGTEYSLAARTGSMTGGSTDGDASPTSSNPRPPAFEPFALEELAVHYKQTVLTAKGGPRVMLVATPLPDSNWAPVAPDGSDSLPSCLDAARKRELPPRLERQLCMLATRPPEWDSKVKAYTLDFHGRVKASSVKNFQLVHWDHNTDRKGSDLVLQYGKIEAGGDDFALDFTYPLNLQKAFAIALASTDSKLCYAI